MKSLLRTNDYHCKELGRDFQLSELSAAAFIRISEAGTDNPDGIEVAAIACQAGVVEWQKESLEDIKTKVPFNALMELGAAVMDHSGIADAKKSKGVPKDGSYSGSH